MKKQKEYFATKSDVEKILNKIDEKVDSLKKYVDENLPTKDDFNAIRKDLDTGFATIGEHFKTLDNKVFNLDNKIFSLEDKSDKLGDKIDKGFQKIKEEFKNVNKRIGNLQIVETTPRIKKYGINLS
jgi:septation ring formation regulator EzrA